MSTLQDELLKVTAERDQLRAENERLKHEFADAQDHIRASTESLRKEREMRLGAGIENERLREALNEYGAHKHWCEYELRGHQCDCGFEQALAQKEEK